MKFLTLRQPIHSPEAALGKNVDRKCKIFENILFSYTIKSILDKLIYCFVCLKVKLYEFWIIIYIWIYYHRDNCILFDKYITIENKTGCRIELFSRIIFLTHTFSLNLLEFEQQMLYVFVHLHILINSFHFCTKLSTPIQNKILFVCKIASIYNSSIINFGCCIVSSSMLPQFFWTYLLKFIISITILDILISYFCFDTKVLACSNENFFVGKYILVDTLYRYIILFYILLLYTCRYILLLYYYIDIL